MRYLSQFVKQAGLVFAAAIWERFDIRAVAAFAVGRVARGARWVAMWAWGLLFCALLFTLYAYAVFALWELELLLETLMFWKEGT